MHCPSGKNGPNPIVRIDTSPGPKLREFRIGIVVADGFSLLRVGMLSEVLHLANWSSLTVPHHVYQLHLLSSNGGNVRSSSTISVWTQRMGECDRHAFHATFVVHAHDVQRCRCAENYAGVSERGAIGPA